MPAVTPAAQAARVAAVQSPIDLLGDIAGSIVALSKSVGEQLQQLANRVEDAALQIEQGQEASAANLEKLRQLQSLLRSIGEGA
jgi:DNA anti-recombination protein RmuC